MRTLKKTLALVLVFAMMIGFGAIGASAAFTDVKADNKYNDAINVLTGFGIIDGVGSNKFDPSGILTREQAAKVITYMLLGPTNAQLVSKATSQKFSDVAANRWSAGYIEYLANLGIISGVGDGKFDPEGKLTTCAWTKMVLTALGYNASSEGMVGDSWAINVAALAVEAGIVDSDIVPSASVKITRDQACQIAFLALEANTVKYTGGSSMTVNGVTITTGATLVTNTQTGLQKFFGATTVSGILTANASTVAGSKVSTIGGVDYKIETGLDLIGHNVTVYAKGTKGYAVIDNTSSIVVTAKTTPAQLKAALAAVGVVTNLAANAVPTYTDGVAGASNDNLVITLGTTGGATYGGKTILVYNKAVIGVVNASATTFARVTAITTTVGAESITISGTTTLANNATSDVVNEYKGIAVGDYVVVTQSGAVYTLVKTTTVTGAISAVGASSASVTLAGTTYAASTVTGAAGLTEAFPNTAAEFTKNTYTLYLDPAGNFIACVLDTGATTSAVVYAVGAAYQAGNSFGVPIYNVQCVNSAGEEVIYTTASVNNTDNAAIAAGFYKVNVINGIATFNATVTAADLAVLSGADTLAATSVKNPAGTYFYAPDVKVVFVSGAGKALTITKLSGLASVAGLVLNNTDMLFFNSTASANKTINTIIVTDAFAGASTSSNLYFANATAIGTTAFGTVYNAYVDGVAKQVTVASGTPEVNKFATYTVDSNGAYAISATTTKAGTIAANGVFGSYVTIASSTLSAASAVVVDARADVLSGAVPATYTTLAAMEANPAVAYTISYATGAAGAVTFIFVTAIA